MSQQEHLFRTATFGGFNRQDVLDYITRITTENSVRVAELEEELAQVQAAQKENESCQDVYQGVIQSLNQELNALKAHQPAEDHEELRGELETLREENAALRAQLEECAPAEETNGEEAQCAQLNARVAQLEEENEALRVKAEELAQAAGSGEELRGQVAELEETLARQKEENAGLRARVEELERYTVIYNNLRNQTADIELDARSRGIEILRRAEEQADQRLLQADQVMEQTRKAYDQVRLQLDSTLAHIVGQLRQVEDKVLDLNGVLDDGAQALAALGERGDADE